MIARLRKVRAAVGATCGVGVLALAGCGAVSHSRIVQSTGHNAPRLYGVPAAAIVPASYCPTLVYCPAIAHGFTRRIRPAAPRAAAPQPATRCPTLVYCPPIARLVKPR